jgi:hypothetical protein
MVIRLIRYKIKFRILKLRLFVVEQIIYLLIICSVLLRWDIRIRKYSQKYNTRMELAGIRKSFRYRTAYAVVYL